MRTRLAMCEFTTMDTTFEEDVALALEFGLGAVAVCEAKLRNNDEGEMLERFLESGLRCASTLPSNLSPLPTVPAGLYPGPSDPTRRTQLMIESLDRLAPFEPESVVFCTGAQGDRSRSDAEDIAVESFRAVARHAADKGILLALEPIRDVGFNGSWLRTVRDSLDFIHAVDEANLTLCFDTYHLWDDPDGLSLLEGRGHLVGAVQISDWHEPPRARGDRLIPGDGKIDLSTIIGTLEEAGYRGTYDVEIFSDDGRWGTALPDSVWAMQPHEVYRRCIAGFERAWASQMRRADK